MMTREDAIKLIENLYPADSEYSDTAAIGQELLNQAERENWRSAPTEILIHYANLCISKEGE